VKPPSFFVSARNRRGVYLFICAALIILFVPRILLYFHPSENITVNAYKLNQLRNNYTFKKNNYYKKYTSFKKKYKKPPKKFNPNNYSENEWMELGLSNKQTAIILKFTKRGIYSNEQLKKIFVIPNQLYELIKDSTFYSEKKNNAHDFELKSIEKEKKQLIFINTASQEELETLPGIGGFFAKNIIKYREKIGGFYSKNQLLEVWKFDLEKLNGIQDLLFITPQDIRKININTATAPEFKTHPYFTWNQANALVKMRIQKGGSFKKIEEIKECVLIDEELFEKLKPYLSL
jgi:competence ComEA-like helix-hairpin-helix protein